LASDDFDLGAFHLFGSLGTVAAIGEEPGGAARYCQCGTGAGKAGKITDVWEVSNEKAG
jgi:hypothetical protein